MQTVRVYFDNGRDLITDINGTYEEIRTYYMGQSFNLGQLHDPTKDCVCQAIRVEFIERTL